MASGNPSNSWWNNNMMMNGNMHISPHEAQQHHQLSSSQHNFYGSSNFLADNIPTQDFPVRSWSHLLLGGLSSDQEKSGHQFHQYKKLENWEDHDQSLINSNNNIQEYPLLFSSSFRVPVVDDVKPERLVGQLCYGNYHHDQDLPATSSPANSCVTSTFNFSTVTNNKIRNTVDTKKHQHPDHSSECNSTSSGGVTKKARVQHSSAQPSLKVRKEKLGDRITALHQLVSPFGKTDTASVLSEAIGYIRFLQTQIQALSTPYLGNNVAVGGMGHSQYQQSDSQHRAKDLRSRGLCLVPLSCIQHVGSDTSSVGDYWAPALGRGYL